MMYRTWLVPYLEGTLDPLRRRELEARLADDPALRADLDAMRQILPKIRALEQPKPTATADAPPLWPALHARITGTRPRRPGVPLAWRVTAVILAGLVLASTWDDRRLAQAGRRADARWHRQWRSAPRVVFHRNNGKATRLAAALRRRARLVMLERRAADAPP